MAETQTADSNLVEPGAPTMAKPVQADPLCMVNNGAGTVFPNIWLYHKPKHSLDDLVRPGYWNAARGTGIRVWDRIESEVGGPAPSDAQRGILIVEEVPIGSGNDVVIAILHRYAKATPVRHDGGPVQAPAPKLDLKSQSQPKRRAA